MKTIVGVLELSSKYRYGLTSRGAPIFLFRPYDDTLTDYVVGCSHRDTSRNQIALISEGEGNRGTLIRLFGPVGDLVAEKEALLQHYCPYKTTKPVIEDTEEERQSLDHWVNFHIDPPGCRDIDDAISYNPATGQWAITIADVAAAVSEGSPTDLAAQAIGATFYDLEGRVLRPMLPPAISEGVGSLLPGERRRGITLFLGEDGTDTFGLTWITVGHSFTYDSFKGSILAGACKIQEDPHDWIESHMIRYNRSVAAVLKQVGAGVLRVQAPGPGPGPALWSSIDPGLGAEAASYEAADPTKDQSHASLGLYCHASSPLRRYADLINQRVLKAIMAGKEPVFTVDPAHLNDRAKANRRFSRELTFLTHVTAGRVHEIDVVWLEADRVWVSAWRRVVRLRHEEPHELGYRGRIQIFCDPTRRNWKQRILTAKV
jgi:exoribonuclease R